MFVINHIQTYKCAPLRTRPRSCYLNPYVKIFLCRTSLVQQIGLDCGRPLNEFMRGPKILYRFKPSRGTHGLTRASSSLGSRDDYALFDAVRIGLAIFKIPVKVNAITTYVRVDRKVPVLDDDVVILVLPLCTIRKFGC